MFKRFLMTAILLLGLSGCYAYVYQDSTYGTYYVPAPVVTIQQPPLYYLPPPVYVAPPPVVYYAPRYHYVQRPWYYCQYGRCY